MTKTTSRGYPLPHPDNIAVEDIARIRQSIIQISTDIEAAEQEDKKRKCETWINLWSK